MEQFAGAREYVCQERHSCQNHNNRIGSLYVFFGLKLEVCMDHVFISPNDVEPQPSSRDTNNEREDYLAFGW